MDLSITVKQETNKYINIKEINRRFNEQSRGYGELAHKAFHKHNNCLFVVDMILMVK